MHRLINAIGFQVGWLICIAAVRNSLEIPALLTCSILIGIHFFYTYAPLKDFKLSLVCLALGIVIDSSLQYFSVISFYGWALGPLSPFWLWMVWAMFALTLNSSLAFLQNKHWILSAVAGLLFGPLSYIAGTKLGAAAFDNTLFSIATLACVWMITLPLLVFISKTHPQQTEVTHDAT
jgi:hypothetical protein